MFKEQAKYFRRMHMLMEFSLVSIALFVSYKLQHAISWESFTLHITGTISPIMVYSSRQDILFLLIGPLIWVGILHYYGGYRSIRQISYSALVWLVFKSVLVSTLIFSVLWMFVENREFDPIFSLIVFVGTLTLIIFERFTMLHFLHLARRNGYNYRQFLIVGTGKRAKQFAGELEKHCEWGMRFLGFVDEADKVGQENDGKKIIGSFDEFEGIIDNNVVDEVLFCMPRKWIDKIEKYIMVCEKVGIRTHLALDFFDTDISKPRFTTLGETPFLCLECTPSYSLSLLGKRAMDIMVSAIFLIILCPFFLLIALLIKLTSHGPIFFGQERCGLNGRRFTMWKYRTMLMDAESMKPGLQELNAMAGPVFKIKNDPRLTLIGKFLRKFSIDELPQLINVLKGEMSLVGPRPPIHSEVMKYDRWQRRRLSVRPGLTCIWQVSGRNKISFEEWMKLDLEYIDKWCLVLDIKIILKTIPAVLKGTGM